MNTRAISSNALWLAASVPGGLRFRFALQRPCVTQLAILQRSLKANAGTAYGRAHNFSAIRDYQDFARKVPIINYDELEPWVLRIVAGEPSVLTRERVTHLVPTSGSTSNRKLIPFTDGLKREFDCAIAPWICDLFTRHTSLIGGRAYWSITPTAGFGGHSDSAVPIGFDADTQYLRGAKRYAANALMAVPSAVRLIQNLEDFRYVTLLCLLRCADLRLISIWHPSFLTLLLDALARHWNALLADVASGGCRVALPSELRESFVHTPQPRRARQLQDVGWQKPQALWPQLRVISCWGDAFAEGGLRELQQRFPEVVVQAKGLLATEAFVTIPFAHAHPLAIRSHFFEFKDDIGRICLADELKSGGEYEIIVTTAGGLWRYQLGDYVRVTGFVGRTPSLKFIGRAAAISDRFGEKLSEPFVAQMIRQWIDTQDFNPSFAMLAPDEDEHGVRYTLFIDASARAGSEAELDELLRGNPHYDYCRRLGQLHPVRIFAIAQMAYETFVAHEVATGKRLGDIKPCALSRFSGWSAKFIGRYADEWQGQRSVQAEV
jgi:hypothetical protein